jgi:hypothetical protein
MALLRNANSKPTSRRATVLDFLPADLRRGMRAAHGFRLTTKTLHALKPLFEGGNDGGTT